MNLTTNDLLIVIGEQTLTIKAQGMQINTQAQRIEELEKLVKKEEPTDGTG